MTLRLRPKAVLATYGILCGIAKYANDLVNNSDFGIWSANLNDNFNHDPRFMGSMNSGVYDENALDDLATRLEGGLLWIEQEGDRENGITPLNVLIPQLHYLKKKPIRKKYMTPHTIHFEQPTESGMRDFQEALIRDALPLVDKMVFLTEGAYDAAIRFANKIDPKLVDKCDVIYHGVHNFPQYSNKAVMRRLFFQYYGSSPKDTKIYGNLSALEEGVTSGKALWILVYGILNPEKTKYLPALRKDTENLIGRPVYITYLGSPHPKGDPEVMQQTIDFLIEATRQDEKFIFIKQDIPDDKLPYVAGSPDLVCLYEPKGTQSGRFAYVSGFPVLILAQNEEGTGMMWRMYGYEEFLRRTLAETAANLLELEVNIARYDARMFLEERRRANAKKIGWPQQGRKHMRLAEDSNFTGTDIGLYERITSTERKIIAPQGIVVNQQYTNLPRISTVRVN